MNRFKTAAAVLFAAAALGGSAAQALAAPAFDAAVHPRRAEVAHRLKVEHMRIEKAKHEGRISPRRARFLHHKERMIRREARFEARHGGGTLTKVEHRRLNTEENRLSKAIAR